MHQRTVPWCIKQIGMNKPRRCASSIIRPLLHYNVEDLQDCQFICNKFLLCYNFYIKINSFCIIKIEKGKLFERMAHKAIGLNYYSNGKIAKQPILILHYLQFTALSPFQTKLHSHYSFLIKSYKHYL